MTGDVKYHNFGHLLHPYYSSVSNPEVNGQINHTNWLQIMTSPQQNKAQQNHMYIL